jgi:hypothetical protein
LFVLRQEYQQIAESGGERISVNDGLKLLSIAEITKDPKLIRDSLFRLGSALLEAGNPQFVMILGKLEDHGRQDSISKSKAALLKMLAAKDETYSEKGFKKMRELLIETFLGFGENSDEFIQAKKSLNQFLSKSPEESVSFQARENLLKVSPNVQDAIKLAYEYSKQNKLEKSLELLISVKTIQLNKEESDKLDKAIQAVLKELENP